ncbi:MAG TPA: hypothetical protein VHG08_19240 [Longimicrobium sp.]|nr:hypothetical protein [Longimicrobium sp.]
MAYQSDRPRIVSLENLTEAAAVGVNLALEDQSVYAASSGDIGTTMGYFPTEP